MIRNRLPGFRHSVIFRRQVLNHAKEAGRSQRPLISAIRPHSRPSPNYPREECPLPRGPQHQHTIQEQREGLFPGPRP
jgi:hypothetical protein